MIHSSILLFPSLRQQADLLFYAIPRFQHEAPHLMLLLISHRLVPCEELDLYKYCRSNIFHERNYHKAALESEYCGSEGKALRFYPLDHRDLRREIGRIFSTGSFWSGSMIVMRNADDSETPARNRKGLGGCWFLRCWGILCAFFVRVLA